MPARAVCGLCCQKQVSQAGISNYIPQLTVGYNYLSQWLHRAVTLRWCHNGRDGVSNHQTHDCLLNRLFRPRSKKTSKLRVTGLCSGNSPETSVFPAQMASNAENVSIWWRHQFQRDPIIKLFWSILTTTHMPCTSLNVKCIWKLCVFIIYS